MASLQEYRAKYPQYNDMSDAQLADALHRKFYSDMDRGAFNERIGLTSANEMPNPRASRTEAFARGAAQGLSVNLADEIAGGGAQKKAQLQAATDMDRLAAMNEAAKNKDWDTYRALQRESFVAGQEANQAKRDEYRARDEEVRADRPGYFMGGEIAGAVGTGVLTGGAGLPAKGATLANKVKLGAATGGAYGAAYGAGGATEGERLSGGLAGGVTGTVAGGVLPVVGAGIRKAGGKVAETYRSVFNPTRAAQNKIGEALTRDAGNLAVSNADMAAARVNAQPVMNVDRGGETTRALARAAANTSPEARAALDRATSDRFASQGTRATRMLQRITGGAVDDLALQDNIRAAARVSNKKAYDAAMQSPQAQQVFTPKLQQLMQSQAVRDAVKKVPATSSNRSLNNIRNPFELNSKGQYVLRQKADGTLIAPNLGFWDQVKRNLDDQIGVAQRQGARSTAADLMSLKTQLVDELDGVVPAYKTARAGAAAAFGAEDAIEAGKNFARSTRNTPEMQRALGKMTSAEKKAFQTGFASELIDRVKSTRDRSNVINSVFGNEESRQKLLMTFGPQKAGEIEAFVRVEGAMDLMRNAMGNSTTARQLVELGLISGGGAGYGMITGDWNNAALIAGAGAARYGAQKGSAKVNETVMKKIADILISQDEKALPRVIQNASVSPAYMNSLRAITDAAYRMSVPAVGMGSAALANN